MTFKFIKYIERYSEKTLKEVGELQEELANNANYSHMITFMLPNCETDMEAAICILRSAFSVFEEKLTHCHRNWKSQHVPFLAIPEYTKAKYIHFHILLEAPSFTTKQIRRALNEVRSTKRYPQWVFKTKAIYYTVGACAYCIKSLPVDHENNHIDTSDIITSHCLFDAAGVYDPTKRKPRPKWYETRALICPQTLLGKNTKRMLRSLAAEYPSTKNINCLTGNIKGKNYETTKNYQKYHPDTI